MLFDEQFAGALSDIDVIGQNLSPRTGLGAEPMDEQYVVGLTVGARFPVDLWPGVHAVWICYLKKQQTAGRETLRKRANDPTQVGFVIAIVQRPGQGDDDVVAGDLIEILHPLDAHARGGQAVGGGPHHAFRGVGPVGVDPVRDRELEKHTGSAPDVEQAGMGSAEAGDPIQDERMIMLVVARRRVEVVARGVGLEELVHVSQFPAARARQASES